MASIARSIAFGHALRPLVRQPARAQPSKLAQIALRSQSPFLHANRVAAFHNTTRKSAFLPPLPQAIEGTVNDPVSVPSPKPTSGSYHWSFERLLAAGLVPLTAAPFIGGALSPVLDAVFCTTLLLHSHIGFEACIIDYFPEQRVPRFHSFLVWLLRGGTILAGVGLYEFETNDVGLTGAVAKIWKS